MRSGGHIAGPARATIRKGALTRPAETQCRSVTGDRFNAYQQSIWARISFSEGGCSFIQAIAITVCEKGNNSSVVDLAFEPIGPCAVFGVLKSPVLLLEC